MPETTRDVLSPVEERHIDYILEEEFCVNPDFLKFFILQARRSATNALGIPNPIEEHGCKAVRSVTTGSGESDVLVTYQSAAALPTAILIEDKIRAGFQPDQPNRYRARGEAGKGRTWSDYWTCLIAHRKYVSSPGDFDAVITLQELQAYFAARPDARSQFRARTLEQAIYKYETSGLQKKDESVTRFRYRYAAEFESRLSPGQWWHQPARDAWWGDTWFECRATVWPKGVLLRHQSEPGSMQLIFSTQDVSLFRELAAKHAAWQVNGAAPTVDVVPVGKGKLAFQLHVPPVRDFASEDIPFEDFFSAVEYLGKFYERCSEYLPQEFRLAQPAQQGSDLDVYRKALYLMLLGYMRSTVTLLGTAMPFPLPDLARLAGASEEDRHFPSLGLMGGFELELLEDTEGQPYLLATQSIRQWGTFEIRHRITASEVKLLDAGDEPQR